MTKRQRDIHNAAVLLGRLAGSAKSKKKALTSRANGKLGGRPRKQPEGEMKSEN